LSINFDRLVYKYLADQAQTSEVILIYDERGVEAYFNTVEGRFIPAIFKIRGDAFYVKCMNPMCKHHLTEYPLDIYYDGSYKNEKKLKCFLCRSDKVKLHLSFPAFSVEEEKMTFRIMEAIGRYIGHRISAVIIIGLSGRWDHYLLRFLFELCYDKGIPLVDVKPRDRVEPIRHFKEFYYPSIKEVDRINKEPESCFLRIESKADEFMEEFSES